MRSLVLVAAVLAAPLAARAQHLPTCDPVSFPQPAPVPHGMELVCGDGQLRDYDTQCQTECGGGCGQPTTCGAPTCTRAHEVCDGRNLGGATCLSLGFGGGTLACGAGCDAFDVSGCAPCIASAHTTCGETLVAHDVAPSGDVTLVASDDGSALALWSHDGHVVWSRVRSDGTLAEAPVVADATDADAVPLASGWLLLTWRGGGQGATLATVPPSGAPVLAASMRAESTVQLWRVDGGGAIATVAERGGPFVLFGPRGARIPLRAAPIHAQRGAARLVVVPTTLGETHEPGTSNDLVWRVAAGDHVAAYVDGDRAGTLAVRDEAVLLASLQMGRTTPDFAVHVGALPQGVPDRADPAWRAAVPSRAAARGAAWLRMRPTVAGSADSWEPEGGRVVTFTAPPFTTPAHPHVFATHASVEHARFFRGPRRDVGVALVRAQSGTRLVVAHTR